MLPRRFARLLLPTVIALFTTGCVSTEQLYARYDQPDCHGQPAVMAALPAPELINWHPSVLFAYNSHKLSDAQQRRLADNLQALTDNPGYRLILRGFTDSVASRGFNQTLSEQRVATVAQWLQQQGIAAGRIAQDGLGESWPITAPGRGLDETANRRVEMLLVDSNGSLVSFKRQLPFHLPAQPPQNMGTNNNSPLLSETRILLEPR